MADWFPLFLFDNMNSSLILLVGALVPVLCILLYVFPKHRKRSRDVGALSQLYIYPVKACRGIELNTVECTVRGLKYDRCWVVVNSEDKFLTQKATPALALVTPELEIDKEGEATVTLNAPEMPALKLTSRIRQAANAETAQVNIWRIQGEGIHCGAEAADWFSSYLKLPGCKVYFSSPEDCQPRKLTTDSKYGHLAKPEDEVGFADFAPVLVASQASLADLNSRLDKPVSIRNFRPNIVVGGSNLKAFEEDNWKRFKIGDVVLRQLKECDRCVVTTLNPDTGEKNGLEPLKTLRKYRSDPRYGASPMFGLYAAIDAGGTLTVGHQVLISEE